MGKPLRVLIVEDSEDDAMLLLRELRRGGYDTSHQRVDTPEAMSAAILAQAWDIVISDYVMPRFSGLNALKVLKDSGIDVPFIIVSGKIGEDIAVDAMRAGAHDYIMKGKLAKLAPTIERELQDAVVRRERKRAEEALKEREFQQTIIAELSSMALAGMDIPALLRKTVESIARTLNVEYCKVLELLPNGKFFLLREGVGWKEGYVGETLVEAGKESQAGYTLLYDKPVIAEDIAKEKRFFAPSLLLEHNVVSGISVKIAGKEKPFGVLGAHTAKKRRFAEYDVHFIQSAADILAEAIQRKEAEKSLMHLNRMYSMLSSINHTIIYATNQQSLFEETCRIAVEQGGFRMAWAGIIDREKKLLKPVANAGIVEGYLDGIRISVSNVPEGKGPTGTVIRQGKHFISNDIEHDEFMKPWREKALKRGYRSSASFPLEVNGQVTGAINFYSEETDFFDEKELGMLDGLSDDVSFALEFMEKEKALIESEKNFRDLYDNAPNAYFSIGADGFIKKCNKRTAEMFGYARDDLIGRNRFELYADAPEGKEKSKLIFERFRKGEEIRDEEYLMQKKDGSPVWVSLTVNAVRDSTGQIVESRSIAVDITERKIAEELRHENERLAFASRTKSEFLAHMSHELRTPLNAILGFSELMTQGLAGKLNEKQERFIDNIHSSGSFLLNLINDILDLSKVEAGKVELVIDKMPVSVTIKETLTLIKEKAMKHNVNIKTELDPALEFIEADKQRFKQILFNLLSNAVKFSKPEGGTVTITAKKEGDMAKFSVSDTGIGIKEENLVKLFHTFEQIEPEITSKYGGTGLGLAISKQLVEQHGGKIRAESRYGEGSTFTFLLPVAAKKKEENQ